MNKLASQYSASSSQTINVIFIGDGLNGSRGDKLFENLSKGNRATLEGREVEKVCLDAVDTLAPMLECSTEDKSVNIVLCSGESLRTFLKQNSSAEESEESNSSLEGIARLLHETNTAVLLLSDENRIDLCVEAMTVGRALSIHIDAVIDTTPDELLFQKLQALISASVKQQELTEQSLLIEETNNHLIREQEVAKAVFEKVASEHRIDLPNVRQWLSPIAVFNGDVFMAAPTPKHELLVLLGDFTGHGLGAALGAIPLASAFYRMAGKGFALKDIVIELNKRLHESLPTGFFCCSLVVKIDFESNSIEYINAGLPDCYWLKRKTGQLQPLVSSALPLGILAPSQFDLELQRATISQGDSLFMFSDGLLETENNFGEAFGTHRVVKCINNEFIRARELDRGGQFLDAIKQEVKQFCGGHERADDISFAEVEIVDFETFRSSYTPAEITEVQHDADWALSYGFGAKSLRNRDPVPQVLNLLLEESGLRENAGPVFSIVSELFNNALDHGVLELDSEIKKGPSGFARYYETRAKRLLELEHGQIDFEIRYEACQETGTLDITVTDSGSGFDWYNGLKSAKLALQGETSELKSHGRGIPLLHELCDHINYSGRGNSVKVVYSWDRTLEDSDVQQTRKIA